MAKRGVASRGSLPPFAELAARLRSRIKAEALPPGSWLGTEVRLAEENGISRMTARRAVQALVDEGLLERRAGRGVFVRASGKSVGKIRFLAGNLIWAPAVRVAQALQDAAQRAGVEVAVTDARGNLEAFNAELAALAGGDAAGAVVMSQHAPSFNRALSALVAADYPFVVVDQALVDMPAASVSSDNRAGGRLVAEAFLARGHRSIAFLGDLATDTTAARAQGVADACAAALVPPPVRYGIPGQRFADWEPSICQRIDELLANESRPTGLACSCDAVARTAIRALRSRGVSVPAEISVSGFDDDPIAEWTYPALTTVRQDFAAMGRKAFEMLMRLLSEGVGATAHADIPVSLVERDSIAPQSPTFHPARHSLQGAIA